MSNQAPTCEKKALNGVFHDLHVLPEKRKTGCWGHGLGSLNSQKHELTESINSSELELVL